MKVKALIFKLTVLLLIAVFCVGAASCKKNGAPTPTPSPQTEYDPNTVIASIGDQTVTYALYKAAFESYAEYVQQMGFNPYASEEDLKGFQELVIDALVADMVTLYHAKEDGFTLSQESIAAVNEQAESELSEIHDEYWALAQTAYEKDSSISVEQHFDQMIGEMSEFYTGRTMNFEEYSADYTNELMNSRLIEEYKDHVCSEFNVTEAQISEWYSAQYESDESLYTQRPGQFKADADYFAVYGGRFADAYPPTYVPEGYSRIMDIVVYPSGSLGEEYNSKLAQLDAISGECSDLLFNDALNNNHNNAARINELLEQYRVLKAEVDEMYESYSADAREKLEQAYAELEAGTPFAEVMAKYTENDIVTGDGTNSGIEDYRTNGQYIAVGFDCENDWSQTVKEIYSIIPKGEYSTIFTDTDGSMHIIYHGEDVAPGAVPLETIYDEIEFIVRDETGDSEWQELLDAWMSDKDVTVDMDIVYSIGKDKLVS